MAIRLTTSFVNTVIPGAYFEQNVRSNPVGIGATGVVAIIGEADGGEVFYNEVLRENVFTPDQTDLVRSKYIAGPIVDAFKALSAPSADANIVGAPSAIYILKTNAGTKASAVIDPTPTNFGTVFAKNYGKDGNKIKFQVKAVQLEETPEAVSGTVPAFGAALDDVSFTIRINGGAEQVITLSNNPANHNNITTLITELNGLLNPHGITVSAGTATNSFIIKINADPANYRKGWGKSLELIDSTPGDLAKLSLTAGLYKSSAESEVEINVVRQDIGINENLLAKGQVALEIGYVGTTATLTISGNILTTSVTGGSGSNLNIDLTQFSTVSALASFISAQTGYSASATPIGTQMNPKDLDKVSGIGICSTGTSLKPGRIKKSLKNVKDAFSTSSLVTLNAIETQGLPKPASAPTFLSGGTKGHTTGLNIVDALTKLEGIAVNFIIPLFSRDASDDIADGLTESGSTYTIDAIHAAAKSHVLAVSNPKLKRHRVAMLSFQGSFNDAQAKAAALANYRCLLTFQPVDQVNSQGEVKTFQPWMGAVVAAGMQAAGFYKGITNKLANLISYKDPSGFDSGSPGDVEQALLSGLLTLQQSVAGIKWISDQTTYGVDSNFVYNSLQAVYAADVISLDLAESFQVKFVGQSLADVSAESAKNFLADKMAQYKSLKLIAASNDAPLGYKNELIKINGPVMSVKVEIKLASTIFFVPISIDISQVEQSA